jgi:hypothetical protein
MQWHANLGEVRGCRQKLVGKRWTEKAALSIYRIMRREEWLVLVLSMERVLSTLCLSNGTLSGQVPPWFLDVPHQQ